MSVVCAARLPRYGSLPDPVLDNFIQCPTVWTAVGTASPRPIAVQRSSCLQLHSCRVAAAHAYAQRATAVAGRSIISPPLS